MDALRNALVRSLGWAAAGATTGAFAAWSFIHVNRSIVGTHDALVVVAGLAAAYGAAMAVAGGGCSLGWSVLRRARPEVRCHGAAALAEGACFAALALLLDAAASALSFPRSRAIDLGVMLALGVAAVSWIAPRLEGARRSGRAVAALALLLFAGAAAGAASSARRPAAAPADALDVGTSGSRVFLIGIDGADWRKIDELVAAGRLPTFAKLIESGLRAPLASQLPTWSPRLWTTIATGCEPDEHGVLDFTETPVPGLERGIQRLRKTPQLPRFGGVHDLVALAFRAGLVHEVPITACHRRVPALWNILSAHGRPVVVVNWYATWPAEPVRGALVSDNHPTRAAYLFAKHGALASGVTGITYPEGLMAELAHVDHFDPGADAEAIVGQPFFAELSDEKRNAYAQRDKYVAAFRIMQTSDAFAVAAAERLLAQESPDLLAVYLSGVDNVSHRNFREPTIIDRYYEYTDGLLRRLVAHADDRTTIVLVSDHGWEYAEGPLVGHEHAPDGVFLASGAQLRARATLPRTPRIEDVAPTVLALLGFPRSAAMVGAPIAEVLGSDAAVAAAARVVRSYGPYTAPVRPRAAAGGALSTLEQEGIQRLKELGYVK